MSALTEQISEVLEQHRPYGLDCKCGEAINSDAWWAAHVAEQVAAALQLTEEWSVQGQCQEGDDCDHFGDHGRWSCSAIAATRQEAAAFPIAKSRGAEVVRRWVSSWAAASEGGLTDA